MCSLSMAGLLLLQGQYMWVSPWWLVAGGSHQIAGLGISYYLEHLILRNQLRCVSIPLIFEVFLSCSLLWNTVDIGGGLGAV